MRNLRIQPAGLNALARMALLREKGLFKLEDIRAKAVVEFEGVLPAAFERAAQGASG